jgi:hypothetical protein
MFKFFSAFAPQPESERIAVGSSNVLGTTGLSRAVLTRMVAMDGLFGSDSVFASADQKAILGQLGVPYLWREGRVSKRATPLPAGLVPVLRTFVEQAACGEGSVSHTQWNAAGAARLSTEERSEVLAVIGLLRATFGVVRPGNCGDTRVTLVPITESANVARAA